MLPQYIRNSAGWNLFFAYAMAVIQLGFAVSLVVLQLTYFAHGRHKEDRELVFGWIGTVTAIGMYI